MKRIGLVLLLLFVATIAWVVIAGTREEFIASDATSPISEQITRGAYLVHAGDCLACHSATGGSALAGGRPIDTPFGRLVTPNITFDPQHGIGSWSADDFWRALHNGRAPDGRFYYPAFPFTSYTNVSRGDADAIYQYLKSLTPSANQVVPTELSFPFNRRGLMVIWRALYFKPHSYQSVSTRSAEWNRGAYLVLGLGHCDACHANRNLLGATSQAHGLGGAPIPIVNWYAPSLSNTSEAGLKNWAAADLVTLLKAGVSRQTAVFGPMAEVVQGSTQYLSDTDLTDLVSSLQDPGSTDEARETFTGAKVDDGGRGVALYKRYCTDCHQDQGEGVANMYPSLANNRAVTMRSPLNTIRMVLSGGYAPVTESNPRPFGMPPFAQTLNDAEIADVVNYVRNSWGNRGEPVQPQEVDRLRGMPTS
jgi:mono/diheme cytochrome c family protein